MNNFYVYMYSDIEGNPFYNKKYLFRYKEIKMVWGGAFLLKQE